GGKLRRSSRLDVLVHVARADWMSLAICVQVVEETRASYLLDVVHQHRQLFVNDDAAMTYVMLADEAEDEATSALDLKMAIAQGRHAVGAVSLDALFRADTEIEIVDETYDDCEHALARQFFKGYVFVGPASERRQVFAEAFDLLILFSLLTRGVLRVIDVLHAPASINADGLQAAAGTR